MATFPSISTTTAAWNQFLRTRDWYEKSILAGQLSTFN